MTQQIINVGALPNDASGDPLRTAFQKINNNFSQLYSSSFQTYESVTASGIGTTAIIWRYPANAFTFGSFQINSVQVGTANAQNITINVSFDGQNANLLYNGFGTLFHGDTTTNPIISDYSIEILNGEILLKVEPAVSGSIWHSVDYRVTYSPYVPSISQISAESAGAYLAELTTENGLLITTE